MLWTPYFTLGHIGRTGGDAATFILCATLDIADASGKATEPNLRATAVYGDSKHRPFDGTEPYRVLILRRLPSWIMSIREHHRIYARIPAWDSEFCSKLKNGDDELRRITNNGVYTVHHMLRCEYLRDDLASLLEKFYKERFTTKMKAVLHSVPTKEALPYNRNVYDFFTEDQLKTLYNNNPKWAMYELQLYGSLLC